jgi:hypothetical protein
LHQSLGGIRPQAVVLGDDLARLGPVLEEYRRQLTCSSRTIEVFLYRSLQRPTTPVRRGAFWRLDSQTQAYLREHYPGSTINGAALRREVVTMNQASLLIDLAALPPVTSDEKDWELPERVVELAPPTPWRPAVRFHLKAMSRADRRQLLEMSQRVLAAFGQPTLDLSVRSMTGVVKAYCRASGISERHGWRIVRAARWQQRLGRRPGETDEQWMRRYRKMGFRPSKNAVLGWTLDRFPTSTRDWLQVLPNAVVTDITTRAADQRVYVPKKPASY